MPEPSLFRRFRDRKLVQWAVAYLAGAFVVFQLQDALAEPLGLTASVQRAVLILVGAGFLITLVLAWFHGEKGNQRVSGLELVLVGTVLVLASAVFLSLKSPTITTDSFPHTENAGRPSIIVLTCENMGGVQEEAYLAAGIHATILNRLAGIQGLISLGRETAKWYRENPKPPNEIAAERGLGFVGECGVMKDPGGDRILVTFQLLDSAGVQVWSREYERDLSAGGFLDIQGQIAQEVAQAIGAALTPEEEAQLRVVPTNSSEASELFLRAEDYRRAGGSGGRVERERYWNRAVDLYKEAIRADSSFALAFVRLGGVYLDLYWFGLGGFEASGHALAAIERALELDPNLAEAYRALGSYHVYRYEIPEALEAYREAGRLRPGDPEFQGGALRHLGDFEGDLERRLRAFDLDPRSAPRAREVGLTLGALRRNEEAIVWFERARSISPAMPEAYGWSALASLRLGNVERARSVLSEAPDSSDWSVILPGFWTESYARNFAGSRSWLDNATGPVLETAYGPRPVALFRGHLFHWEGDTAAAQASYREAVRVLDSLGPREDRPLLGIALTDMEVAQAGAGHRQVALAILDSAMALRRELNSPWANPVPFEDAGFLYVLLGETESAIDVLEDLVEKEYHAAITLSNLRLDPRWDPLRTHPRFVSLLERTASKGDNGRVSEVIH